MPESRASRAEAMYDAHHRMVGDRMANIFVCVFAVALCLMNAVIWTFMSEMPLVGICWVGAAAGCYALQKWARG